jgi:hypothetical protein
MTGRFAVAGPRVATIFVRAIFSDSRQLLYKSLRKKPVSAGYIDNTGC